MKSILLFIVIASVTATNLRKEDATLFREPPQEAKVERPMETQDECQICQNIAAVMQNTVAKNSKLLHKSKLQEFKTLARHACHGFHITKEEKQCLEIVDDPTELMNHLYDLRPSACEKLGHCMRCKPCPYPAECMVCDPPDDSERGFMDMVHTSWKSFKEWMSTPVKNNEAFIWDPMSQER